MRMLRKRRRFLKLDGMGWSVLAVSLLTLSLVRCTPLNTSVTKSSLNPQEPKPREVPQVSQPQTAEPIHVLRYRTLLLVPGEYVGKVTKIGDLQTLVLSSELNSTAFEEFKKQSHTELSVTELFSPGWLPDEAWALLELDGASLLTQEDKDAFDTLLRPASGGGWSLSVLETVSPALVKKVMSHLVEVTIVFGKSGQLATGLTSEPAAAPSPSPQPL